MAENNQRIMLTKKLLKDSFTQLLQKQNIYKISIRELCENAGINRSTFYKYYGSQYDLLSEMENEMLSFIQNKISSIDYGKEMEEQMSALLVYMEENAELVRLFINNNVDTDFPAKLFSLPQIQESLRLHLASNYPPQQIDYVSTFVIDGAYNMLGEWINKDKREPAHEMAALLIGIINKVCLN